MSEQERKRKIEEILAKMTGGRKKVKEIPPFKRLPMVNGDCRSEDD